MIHFSHLSQLINSVHLLILPHNQECQGLLVKKSLGEVLFGHSFEHPGIDLADYPPPPLTEYFI